MRGYFLFSFLLSTLFFTFVFDELIILKHIDMKHLISFLLALVVCSLGLAQERVSKVVMKNGVTITGRIVEFNPVSHIVLNVAGFDSRIEMSDIDSIEEVKADTPITANVNQIAIDTKQYEETKIIQVGPYSIEMVLVPGAVFEMGYDGRGSRAMFSEPVHPVQLSSFYVNKSPLRKEVVDYVLDGKETRNEKAYNPSFWKTANRIAEAIASKTNLPIRLISEAQCEYLSTSDFVTNKLDIKKNEVVFCYDFYSEYRKTEMPQLDPIGPNDGSDHVIRFFTAKGEDIYTRLSSSSKFIVNSLRITIPASSLN